MRCYCTYFDSNYLARFLAMYRSLRRYSPGGIRMFALCFDEEAEAAIRRMGYRDIEPIAVASFEEGDEALAAAKRNRSRIEYYFTCTASLVLYVFRHHPDVALLTYLDADLYFFASPEPVFAEMGDASVLVIEHRHAPQFEKGRQYGTYNVGFLSFRRDANGSDCLTWWRERCLEWCHDRCEDGKFADQKYLDEWPERFSAVHVVRHSGANVAPWNLPGYKTKTRGRSVSVNGDPVLFYHFEGFRWTAKNLVDPGLQWPGRIPRAVVRRLHIPYIREVLACRRICSRVTAGAWIAGNTRKVSTEDLSWRMRIRLLLAGRHVLVLGRWLVFCDSPLLRRVVGWIGRTRSGNHPGAVRCLSA